MSIRRYLVSALAFAMAGSAGFSSSASNVKYANTRDASRSIKSPNVNPTRSSERIVKNVGGLDLGGYFPEYGMSPKEYGIRFGHGNKRSKTNFLRLKHNAKLRRRCA